MHTIEIHLPEGAVVEEAGWDGKNNDGQIFKFESLSIGSIKIDGVECDCLVDMTPILED